MKNRQAMIPQSWPNLAAQYLPFVNPCCQYLAALCPSLIKTGPHVVHIIMTFLPLWLTLARSIYEGPPSWDHVNTSNCKRCPFQLDVGMTAHASIRDTCALPVHSAEQFCRLISGNRLKWRIIVNNLVQTCARADWHPGANICDRVKITFVCARIALWWLPLNV